MVEYSRILGSKNIVNDSISGHKESVNVVYGSAEEGETCIAF